MKDLTIKGLIDFRRKKTDKGKRIFVDNIKSPKIEVSKEGGGHYWISALSTITESYRRNAFDPIDTKITDLEKKLKGTKRKITQDMYIRNLFILDKYKTRDHTILRPNEELTYLKKSIASSALSVRGFKIVQRRALSIHLEFRMKNK